MKKIVLYYTDRYCGKGSHQLLMRAASLYSSLPVDSFQIVSILGKKPYFSNYPEIHFSISHSENLWICAFAEDEVGVDVQILSSDRPWSKLAERFFSTEEADTVKNANDTASTFSRIWSRKEAVVKLLGIGIEGSFATFSTLSDTLRFKDEDIFLRDFVPDIRKNLSAAIAYFHNFELEILKLI